MKHVGRYCYKTDIGKVRISNEDNAIAIINSFGDILLCVCDGMGGYKKGDYASKTIIDYLHDSFLNKRKFLNKFTAINWASNVLKKANRQIFKEAQLAEYKDMGSTVVLALIVKKSVIVLSAGDSRCYFYDQLSLKQVTNDQTYASYLISTGKLKQEDAESDSTRHVLTNAIGIFPVAKLDVNIFPYNGQNILLCSDGLYNNLSKDNILACINTNEDIGEKVSTLIACANSNGGSDNIAVVLWESKND